MTSTGVNVLRWSALAFGVFYGFSHQRTITSSQKAAHEKHEWDSKQKLIDQAKSEYAKLKKPATPASGDECTSESRNWKRATHTNEALEQFTRGIWSLTDLLAIYDPNNSKFDLEKLLEKVSAENP